MTAVLPLLGAAQNSDADLLAALRTAHVEDVLLPLLWQIALIILVARVFAMLFRWWGQPSTVGEIAAGLVIGPSVLGKLFPGAYAAIFHPEIEGLGPALSDQLIRWVLTSFSQIGLVLLLFLIGMEFDFRHLRVSGRSAIAISVTGILLPFLLGIGVGELLWQSVGEEVVSGGRLGFLLFLGTAMSITALPILGRIMVELGISRSRIGTVTISSGAVDDALGWILLATVAALVKSSQNGGGMNWSQSLIMLAETVVFALVMVYLVRPFLTNWARNAVNNSKKELSLNNMALLLALLFACSIITNLIGIFAIFGAFLLGAILSDEAEFREAVSQKFRDFVTAFFLPIFFAYTGARTDIGTLGTPLMWGLCGLVLTAAIAGKFGGCSLAAWLTGSSPREATCIGVMMNTRALMELVVVNVGKDLGVIPDSVYCMLVIMALVTTIMTTPILLRAMRGTELEPLIEKSGFLKTRTV